MASSVPGPQRVPRHRQTLQSEDIPWPAYLRVLFVWLVSVVLVTMALVARLPFSGQVTLSVGDVAARDIAAPRQATYVSELLTQQRRAIAANAVPEVFDPPQARVGRQQLALAGQLLDYIASVRSDSYADTATKTTYLRAAAGLDLSPEVISHVLALPAPGWERVANEVQVVLERAMREEIRESSLADERRKVPARVRLDFADEDAAVVSDIVQDLLAPNSFYNAERTEARRQAAREAVEPITATFERNETILRAGDIVTDLDIEALKALGLQQSVLSWKDIRSAAGFVLLLGLVFLYYLWRREPGMWFASAETVLLAAVVVVFMFGAKAVLPARTLLPYLFPYAALTILLSIVLHLRIALVVTALFALVVGWLTGGSVEFMTYAVCGALVGALKLRHGDRLSNYAWAAGYIIACNLAVVVVFRIAGGSLDVRGLVELGVSAVVNSLIVITVTLLGLYTIGAIFGVTTPLQLMEISRPTHPLLRQLLLKAPGTYHHTLIVSNMAERAAEAIGADALLTRVGAYYHDVGKTIRPYFFVENRTENMDPHARLDPYTSAQIIVTHVKDGMDLARKYKLPDRVIEFIPEHQGTLLVSYFYHQAVQQAGSPDAVDKAQFRYPGPKPRSRETAITMLADGAEATVRSRRPGSAEELEQIVADSIQSRLLSGQLEDSPLTIADLSAIRQAFVDVLRGLHHPRISYPADSPPSQEAEPAIELKPEPPPDGQPENAGDDTPKERVDAAAPPAAANATSRPAF